METLNYIQALMGAYALDLSSIDTENEAEYNERAKAVRVRTVSLFNAMRDSAPELLQYNFADSMSDEEVRRTINRIALDANKRYTALSFQTISLPLIISMENHLLLQLM